MAFDEMYAADGSVRPPYAGVAKWLAGVNPEQLEIRRLEAELFYRRGGVTFAVYGDNQGEERIIPFDIIPRILSTAEWARLSNGLEQRVRALNMYLADIYGKQTVVKVGLNTADQKFLYREFLHVRQELLIESGIRFKYLLAPFGFRNALCGSLP